MLRHATSVRPCRPPADPSPPPARRARCVLRAGRRAGMPPAGRSGGRRRYRAPVPAVDLLPERAVTLVALVGVALLMALLVRAALPPAWRPAGPGLVLAVVLGYLAVQLSVATGLGDRLDREVLAPLGGSVGEVETWVAAGVGALVVAVWTRARRGRGR